MRLLICSHHLMKRLVENVCMSCLQRNARLVDKRQRKDDANFRIQNFANYSREMSSFLFR